MNSKIKLFFKLVLMKSQENTFQLIIHRQLKKKYHRVKKIMKKK